MVGAAEVGNLAELREDWASRFQTQGSACEGLGSHLYARLMEIIADDIRSGGPSWDVISDFSGLRYGQMGPLRLVGGAHRLAVSGEAPEWAALMPSCGGEPPAEIERLRQAWLGLVDAHPDALRSAMGREVQTNEVGRSAGLALALASTGFDECALIELGCSGGLNLRLDRFESDLAEVVLGEAGSALRLAPEMRSMVHGPGGALGLDPGLRIPEITSRVGIDPHPIDASSDEGSWTLSSFVWPDQTERFRRLTAALEIAATCPVELVKVSSDPDGPDTADALRSVLDLEGPRAVQHSIVWQYIPTTVRWKLCRALEEAGRAATPDSPLAWIRYEPDEWNRARAAIWLRTWPGGADRLIAHVDFHGRWLEPVPTLT
ncbi:MAG: DUF2332 domain-containing protein [Microthrixaceae bacterium]